MSNLYLELDALRPAYEHGAIDRASYLRNVARVQGEIDYINGVIA